MSDETNAGAPIESPEPLNATPTQDFEDRLTAQMEARIQKIQSDYDRKIKALESRQNAALKSARGIRAVDHLVPTNAGGEANEIHETWSQYHQELANAGLLTDAHRDLTLGRVPEDVQPDEESADV